MANKPGSRFAPLCPNGNFIIKDFRSKASHSDTTVNLYDQYIVVRGEDVVDVWPIDARGRVQ